MAVFGFNLTSLNRIINNGLDATTRQANFLNYLKSTYKFCMDYVDSKLYSRKCT